MDREKEILLKARIRTLQVYLEDVFVLLKNVEEVRGKADKKLSDFRKEVEYQDKTEIELEE